MRCLYCGKELALLKRLTGGSEFCSDAHRKRYQEEFNDLALSRLLQTQPPPPKPLPEPEPVIVAPVVAAPVAVPAPAPTKPTAAAKTAAPTPKTVPPARVKEPEPKDPVVGMTGYMVEQPLLGEVAYAVVGGEPYFAPNIPATLPSRGIIARALARSSNGLPLATPIALRFALLPAAAQIRPRTANVEVREFSRKAITPAVTPQQTLQIYESTAPSAAIGEAMEIINHPHPPADPPVIWQAGPVPDPPVDLLLGALARIDFGHTGFDEDLPSQLSHHVPAPQVALVEPIAAPPALNVETTAPEPIAVQQQIVTQQTPAEKVPEPATKPLPITLHGSSTGAAKPASIFNKGLPASIEPQVPPSSGLPLRPTVILAPRPAPAAPPAAPKPLPAPVAASTPVRPASKNRRPEIRVVQAAPPGPQPVRAPIPTPAPAAKAPVAMPDPAPARAATPTPPPAKPDIDLHLPEIHNPEVQGAWAKMPIAVKAGMGAVVALGIIGIAYSAMNSSNASAKPSAVQSGPAYNLGKQINSGGWIEDWAPADKERRITLLRGSQPYSDYRIEFEAQIQSKAIGWMYRGLNPKNFYVVKLEKLKSGLEPVVALVRYAVIDGENERRIETILPMQVRVDTTYKIRFDAVGSEFAVWVQGKKVDQWRDTRLGSGGLGLYAEGDEAAAIHGTVNVFELVSTR